MVHPFHENGSKCFVVTIFMLKGKKCGQIGPERLPESLNVDRQKVNLEFHSDDKFTSRGFWMEYKGTDKAFCTLSLHN